MTVKSDIAAGVADECNLSKQDAKRAVDAAFEIVADLLSSGERVQIHGFGVFDVKDTKPRVGRNPRTGEAISIPAGKKVAFKPAPALKEVL